jgi:hypothetical protein
MPTPGWSNVDLRNARPFLKYAGGKGQLLDKLALLIPSLFDRYIEPFLGGGAMFFYMISKGMRFNAYLSDTNVGAIVRYLVYPNGKVMVFVACSNNPFKLEDEADESILYSFLGQVRDRLLYLMTDPHERIVPPIMQWILTGCDINKDVTVSDKLQLTAIKIRIPSRHLNDLNFNTVIMMTFYMYVLL